VLLFLYLTQLPLRTMRTMRSVRVFLHYIYIFGAQLTPGGSSRPAAAHARRQLTPGMMRYDPV